MHERLYANQSRMSTADVADYAKAIELDVDRFSTCLAGDVSKVVKADIEKGNTLGVTGTPVLFIGTLGDDGQVRLTTRFSGTATFDTLKRVVDQTAPRQEGWLARWLE
jgi:protein-disulfide isomerase